MPSVQALAMRLLRTSTSLGARMFPSLTKPEGMSGAPTEGTQFFFFLAVPTILGAAVYNLYKNRAIISVDDATMIAIGFVVAFICALFVVRTLVGFVSRHGFGVFAWYRIVIGSLALVLLVLAR